MKQTTYSVVSAWYNEEKIAPFFLAHYEDATKILILLDTATSDSTREILAKHPIVVIQEISYPNGFDADIKTKALSKAASAVSTEWVIVVDADEFVFAPDRLKLSVSLTQRSKSDIIFARMWNVYRNLNDTDLDSSKPLVNQRLHGILDRTSGHNRWYSKPIIYRPQTKITLSVGQHYYRAPVGVRVSQRDLFGVHWASADPSLSKRAIHIKSRQSSANIERGNSTHVRGRSETSWQDHLTVNMQLPRVVPGATFGALSEIITVTFRRLLHLGRDYFVISDCDKWHDARKKDFVDLIQQIRILINKTVGKISRLLDFGSK